MKLKFWQTEKREDVYPLATNHEQIAGDICVQLGHLSENAIVEILKIVVKRKLPHWSLGHKPYTVNPKTNIETSSQIGLVNPRKAEAS
jgi:hypothetical protein